MNAIENNVLYPKMPNFVDERIIEKVSVEVMDINPYNDAQYLYNKFYTSKYAVTDISKQESELKKHIQNLKNKYGNKIKTSTQGIEYEWIMINFNALGNIAYRFYISPNPENMHKIVEALTTEFLSEDIAVALKYQQKFKYSNCDRIIIYCDYDSRKKIENIISRVYQNTSKYFEGSERALPWIYETQVSNVYLTPETKGVSYGKRFVEIMLEAKFIFSYINNITFFNNNTISNSKEEIKSISVIFKRLLLMNGLLLDCDKKSIVCNKLTRIYYDYNTGFLTVYMLDGENSLEIKFLPNQAGRRTFIDDFFELSRVVSQEGVEIKLLSEEELKQKIYIKNLNNIL